MVRIIPQVVRMIEKMELATRSSPPGDSAALAVICVIGNSGWTVAKAISPAMLPIA